MNFLLSTRIILFLAFFCLSSFELRAQNIPLNLSFESRKSNEEPFIWKFNKDNNNFSVRIDTSMSYKGKASLEVQSLTNDLRSSLAVYNYLDSSLIKGKSQVRISCYVKYTNIRSSMGPKIYVNQQGSGSKYETSQWLPSLEKDSISGWELIELTVKIDPSKERFMFGLLTSTGKVWYDKVRIEIDDVVYNDPKMKPYPEAKDFVWLSQYISELGITDMAFISTAKDKIDKARIVGLGEANHGAHEFYETKKQIIKELVKYKGFNVIALESPMAEAHELNKFIQSGEGNIDTLINNRWLFTIHNTEEIKDLLLWLQKENKNRKDKIYFEGVDIQSPFQAMNNIVNYFGSLDMLKDDVYSLKVLFPKKKSLESYQNSLSQLMKIEQKISSDSQIAKKVSNFEWAQYNLVLLKQSIVRSLAMLNKEIKLNRDSLLAENLMFLSKHYKNSKIIFWAHNAHVDKYSFSAGKTLYDKLGDKYLSVGFAAREGYVREFRGLDSGQVVKNIKLYEGSIEYHLTPFTRERIVLDLAKINNNESPLRKKMINDLGFGMRGVYSALLFEKYEALKRFDILIFFNKISPTRVSHVKK